MAKTVAELQKVELPNGAALYYDDDKHAYYRCKQDGGKGKRLLGVTTVAKVFDIDNNGLLKWAAKTQCIGVAEAYEEGGSTDWLGSADAIWQHLEELKLTFIDVRDRAGKRGTNVHELAFEALARNEQVPYFDKMTDEEQGHAKAVMGFWLDHEPDAEQVEQIVFSENLGVAGRLDFRGKMQRCHNLGCGCHRNEMEVGTSGIIDCKTGNYVSTSDHVQVGGGYRRLSEESGFGPSKWSMILHTRADGSYRLLPTRADAADFYQALVTYRAVADINRLARADRESIK